MLHKDYEDNDYLAHYGILGQKWGIRRYQNEDGTLTPEGRARYGTRENFEREVAKSEKRKRVLKGAAIGAGVAATAIIGANAYKNYKNSLDPFYGLKGKDLQTMRSYTAVAGRQDAARLEQIKSNMMQLVKDNPSSPNVGKWRSIYMQCDKELIKRTKIQDEIKGAGRKAIDGLFKTGKESFNDKFAKGMGTAMGAAAVGGIISTMHQMTEERDRDFASRRNEYSEYMFPNPNPKKK